MNGSPAPDPDPEPRFAFALAPRYAEIDQQGVVFFGHYLTWFDEACTAFLAHVGASYPELIAAGVDLQLAHSEVDYAESVRWGDDVRIDVGCERIGTTSFTVAFGVRRAPDAAEPAVTGRLVYVCVTPGEWTKRPVPEPLAAALSATPGSADPSAPR